MKIHIKKANRGTFTKAATEHGKGVQAFASQVLAHKENYSPAMVKKANFAHNAAGWRHEYGGPVMDTDADNPTPEYAKGGNWIHGAVNPAHKGFCTPMTKATCTPRRKAFAETMKKHHGFHEYGGPAMPKMLAGGDPDYTNPWQTANPNDAIMEQMYDQRAHTQDVVQNSDMYGQQQPMVTGDTMTPNGNGTNPNYWQQAGTQPQMTQGMKRSFGTNTKNILGAGLLAAGYFADRKNEKDRAQRAMQNGMTSMYGMNPMDYKGNYDQQGQFRPQQRGYSNPGMYYPGMKMGGNVSQYEAGGVYEMDPVQAQMLQKLGYKFEIIP